jgi:hypothetical protein
MAEPNDASPASLGPSDQPAGATPARSLFSTPLVVVQTAASTGHGLWMVLGAAVALGLYSDGRGEVLVPLSIGLVLVSLGLIATCLRLPFAPEWHGWNPVKPMMPTPEGMVAMANYLPMLALAGLARGGNDFWATRLAGAVLMLCSLATLIYTARVSSRYLPTAVAVLANVLPLGRTVTALFAGGLWFWLCITLQTEAPIDSVNPWRLVLLPVAMALGFVEIRRWRALRRLSAEGGLPGRAAAAVGTMSRRGWRIALAVLSVVLPCILVILHPKESLLAPAAGLAALSCVIGQCLEQRLYGRAYAQLADG